MRSANVRSWLSQILVAAFVAVIVSQGSHLPWANTAQAEPRRTTPQAPDEHFKSGGRLSETVLQEMLVVLKRIDERLERLEKVASSGVGVAPSSNYAPGNISTGGTGSSARGASALPAIEVRRGS